MKLITWNCNMAFRKKIHLLLEMEPDILVIPECEDPGKLKFPADIKQPTSTIWFGKNKNKGLGVFSFGNYSLHKLRGHNKEIQTIIPVQVTNKDHSFNLYAIWANNPDDPDGQYVEQVWKAIHHYGRRIKKTNTILVGDFNSNTIWDKKYRVGNHSHVVKKLARKGIHSCYHLHHQQTHGKESHPTFYLYKHWNKPYHLDYCFASKDLSDMIRSVEIGEHGKWMKYSDHVPVVVTFGMNIRTEEHMNI